ncbi:MAG: hypothetical protein QOE35_3911 [Actinomycetota bacterium]
MSVVAIVAAKDRAASVGVTVAALLELSSVDEVLVVDDGSIDGTAEVARAAGATVLRLPVNAGKGAAVTAGVSALPDTDVYLLVDDDTGATAALAERLLSPVVDGDADMTIAVLPPAGRRGGFGTVAKLARGIIRRASRFEPRAPLSGQRAVRGPLLRSLVPLADRFGLETALTIDAVRNGARVVEVDVAMDHAHTGRSIAGFRHRAGQGRDILRAAWPRLTSSRQRIALMLVVVLAFTALAVYAGSSWEASSRGLPARYDRVVLFGVPRLSLDDVERGLTPNLDRLLHTQAMAAMSVRTFEGRPSTAEGYTALGAGARLRGRLAGGLAYAADAPYEGGTAAQALSRRTGRAATGAVAVLGGPSIARLNSGQHLPSVPGALGQTLHDAGMRTAVVGNADNPASRDPLAPAIYRPAALAVMSEAMTVDGGAVSRGDLLLHDASAPWGVRADPERVLAEARAAMTSDQLVVVDPGDLDRAAAYRRVALDRAADAEWDRAVRRTDALLGAVLRSVPPRTLTMVVSPSPPTAGWHLMPAVATGEGIRPGYLHSPSTKRLGVVTITDVAPTILHELGVTVPSEMIGHALRFHPTTPSMGDLRVIDRDAAYRERIAYPVTLTFIIFQAVLYLLTMVAFGRRGGVGRVGPVLRWVVLGIAAFPVSSFILRLVPDVPRFGAGGIAVLIAIDVALVAVVNRSRRHPLSPLAWILGITAAVIMVDTATGVHLQTSSLLGYSLHIAARFYGLGNAAFAVLAACALLWAAIHVHYAPRRREALLFAAAVLALVIIVDGAPSLGDDVGGIITLVPAFGLTMYVMSGRRLSWRAVLTAAGLAVVVLGIATGIDLLRPPEARTHLGRLVTDVHSGGNGVFFTTVLRKLSTNIRILGTSVWTWILPIIAIFTLYLLVWERRWSELLPPRSALRAGAVGTLVAGLLGFAANDSGVIVAALVFVFFGPYLTLLALAHERSEPARLDAPDPEAAPVIVG